MDNINDDCAHIIWDSSGIDVNYDSLSYDFQEFFKETTAKDIILNINDINKMCKILIDVPEAEIYFDDLPYEEKEYIIKVCEIIQNNIIAYLNT